MKRRIEMQERNLEALSRNGGFEFTDTFKPYTSGEIGPYYIQSAAIMANGLDYVKAYDNVVELIDSHMKPETSVISGGESRDWMFSFNISNRFTLPHAMIYKDGKVYGAGDLKGKKVLHVADLNNEGSSIRDLWVPTIKERGGNIDQVFFYVDRMEDGVQVVKDLGLKSYAVVPLDGHAWDHLQKIGAVSPEVYRHLMQRMEDKDAWARKMLRSDAGIERFVELALNLSTRSKVDKIMTKGYPDMEGELIGILEDRTNLDMDAWVKGM